MKVSFTSEFMIMLNAQVAYIARDKPKAAINFKIDLLKKLKSDRVKPFYFRKSVYFNSEKIRDYVFKDMSPFMK